MSILREARQKYGRLRHFYRHPSIQLETNAVLLANLHLKNHTGLGKVESLTEVELKVFSQFGEDGIIQYLINRIPVVADTFVEFGVEQYVESNTRFLLINNNWRGVVIDGGENNIRAIRGENVSVHHDLTSVHAFVTAENINEILEQAGCRGEIGLLSIDIDGNDYWIWKAIEAVSPCIVVCEYNSVLGPDAAVTIPYDAKFDYKTGHYSWLYYGASLSALCRLADEKGYLFAGCNSAGNDAFFVRKEFGDRIRTFSPAEGFVESRFRDSRGLRGEKTFLRGKERLQVIEHLPVYDLDTGSVRPIREALGGKRQTA